MGRRAVALGVAGSLVASGALAHTGVGATSGLGAGFAHPFSGLDHLLAMVAVGLWAGLVGGRALWAWPLAFVAAMIVGALAGFSGLAFSGVETLIAVSLFVLGGAVVFRAPVPVLAGVVLCGAFAFFHGHAHGAELPSGAWAVPYIAGFVLATAILHAVGLALGAGLPRVTAAWLPLAAGAGTAVVGAVLLIG